MADFSAASTIAAMARVVESEMRKFRRADRAGP
jgi:hypothetical protein